MFSNNKYSFSITALTESTICLINVEIFRKVFRANDDFAEKFLTTFSNRYMDAINRLVSITQKQMSFLDHLEELRWLLVRSFGAIVFFAIFAFIFKSFIFDKIIFVFQDPNFITYKVLCSLSKLFSSEGLCIDKTTFNIQNEG